jgi:hypothetical protein
MLRGSASGEARSRNPLDRPGRGMILWSTYGDPMEYLWNPYGATRKQFLINTLAGPKQQASGSRVPPPPARGHSCPQQDMNAPRLRHACGRNPLPMAADKNTCAPATLTGTPSPPPTFQTRPNSGCRGEAKVYFARPSFLEILGRNLSPFRQLFLRQAPAHAFAAHVRAEQFPPHFPLSPFPDSAHHCATFRHGRHYCTVISRSPGVPPGISEFICVNLWVIPAAFGCGSPAPLPFGGFALTAVLCIRSVDTTGGLNRGSGAVGGLYWGMCRTVLWYQGRSRVVPDCYQCAPGAQPALLSIANAYTSQPTRGHTCAQQGPSAPRLGNGSASVPEGQMRIAQGFNPGDARPRGLVPKGRLRQR